ncbi:MAG: hypothetical protein ACJATN_001922 [Neolewinella sp.]
MAKRPELNLKAVFGDNCPKFNRTIDIGPTAAVSTPTPSTQALNPITAKAAKMVKLSSHSHHWLNFCDSRYSIVVPFEPEFAVT